MLNEGYRVIFINFNYNTSTGKLKYAASIFRRNKCFDTGFFSSEDLANEGKFYYADEGDGFLYYEITDQDVENHMHTTDRRFEIRPVKITVGAMLTYDELIGTIRWEMCHGHGCKGPRISSSRPSSVDSVCSDNSFLSTDSQPEMSYNLRGRRTVKYIKYFAPERDIFIAFKALAQTGEVAFGAAIRQRNPTDEGPPSEEVIASHLETAEERLDRNPVVFTLTDEQKDFSHQLKSRAVHREDVTQFILSKIFERRGGRMQVREYNN